MNVILRTRCGCERVVDPGHGAQEYHVPLLSRFDLSGPPDTDIASLVTTRRYQWMGKVQSGMQVWEEQDERRAVPPEPLAHLTTGEWADAVARFRAWVRGDSHATDVDFLRRHDGAQIIQHKNTGALIGAFYPAPSWSHSAEGVAMFSALRALLSESPDDPR